MVLGAVECRAFRNLVAARTEIAASVVVVHGPNGAGIPAQFPRVAGQYSEYSTAQLQSFRAGERANDPNSTMRAIAAKLSDGEIKAVAEYIAGLR